MSLTTSQTDYFPECLQRDFPYTWIMSGEGVFNWTVFKLYRARLYVSGLHYDPAQPFLLELSYLRTLPAEMIVSASVDELKRLRQPSSETLQSWSEALNSIVPDVTLDDRLIGCFVPGKGITFYSADQQLGQIADPVFAEAFAAIWLDPDTRSGPLREALLGQSLCNAGNEA